MDLTDVKKMRDPAERAAAAAGLLADAELRVREIRAVQDTAARAMLADGATFADVGRALGITRSAVAQRFKKP